MENTLYYGDNLDILKKPSGLIRFDIQGFFCYDMEKDIILSRRVFYETIKRVLLY